MGSLVMFWRSGSKNLVGFQLAFFSWWLITDPGDKLAQVARIYLGLADIFLPIDHFQQGSR
jgi:hypothetical protein